MLEVRVKNSKQIESALIQHGVVSKKAEPQKGYPCSVRIFPRICLPNSVPCSFARSGFVLPEIHYAVCRSSRRYSHVGGNKFLWVTLLSYV